MRSYYWMLILVLLIIPGLGKAQVVNWQDASNWRLYDSLPRNEVFKIESLKSYRYVDLDPAVMRGFLIDVSLLPAEKTQGAVWMGFYRVSCNIGDSVKILIISRYGGFFADLGTKVYYQIPVPEILDWNTFFDTKFSELHKSLSP